MRFELMDLWKVKTLTLENENFDFGKKKVELGKYLRTCKCIYMYHKDDINFT